MSQTSPTPANPSTITRWALPLVGDLACVLAFAFGGKSAHEATDSNLIVLVIVWPYALAAVLAHAGLISRGRPTLRVWPEGVVILTVTYVLGMALRVVSGRGIEIAFLLVAIAFLTLTMLGWRLAVLLVARGRRR